ncbi:MAG: hypothetical protein ACK4K2_07665 [Dehalococcoidia bacterium]
MPRKSRRRGRRPRPSVSAPSAGTATLPPKAPQAPTPVLRQEPSPPRSTPATSVARLPLARELRAIGVVAGVCVAILLVLWVLLR